MKNLVFLLCLGIVLFFSQVEAATMYVDGSISPASCGTYSIANRNCSGSDGTAYKTLQGYCSVAVAGDIGLVRAGTYAAATNVSVCVFANSGTQSQPIYVRKYASESPIIEPVNPVSGNNAPYGFDVTNRHYITIDGMEIRNANHGVMGADGSDHIEVLNSYMHHNFGTAVTSWAFSHSFRLANNVITNNAFGCYPRGICPTWGAAMSLNGLGYHTVENNVVFFNHGEGINLVGTNSVVRNNIISDNWSTNIYSDGPFDNYLVEDNIVWNTEDAKGLPCAAPCPYGPAHNARGWSVSVELDSIGLGSLENNYRIFNNLFINTSGVGFLTDANGNTATNMVVANNTFVESPFVTLIPQTNLKFINNIVINSSGNSLVTENALGSTMTWDHNMWYGNNGFCLDLNSGGPGCESYSAMSSALGFTNSTFGTSPLLVNPSFVPGRLWNDSAYGFPSGAISPSSIAGIISNYSLQASSTAIDSGANTSSLGVTADYLGISRPFNSVYDKGALEYTGGSPPALHIVTVNSSGASGCSIGVSLTDTGGNSNGTTNFTRSYASGATVGFTAPNNCVAMNFSSWACSGGSITGNVCTITNIQADQTITATFTSPTNPSRTLTTTSAPTNAAITINNGLASNATHTSATTIVPDGTAVVVTAAPKANSPVLRLPLTANSNDTSGLANNGTATSVTYSGSGGAFNGTSSNITIPASNFYSATNEFTIAATINATSLTAVRPVFLIARNTPSIAYGPTIHVGASLCGGAVYVAYETISGGHVQGCGSTVLSTGVTYKVVAIFDGSTLTIKLNGVTDGTPVSTSAIATYAPGMAPMIGTSPFAEFFSGTIKDVVFDSRAWGSSDVTAYGAGTWADGAAFVSWTGCTTASGAICNKTMTQDGTINAVYTPSAPTGFSLIIGGAVGLQ